MTQLFDEGVPGCHFFLKVEGDASAGAVWNHHDNNVKGSKDNPQDEVPQVQVESNVPCDHVLSNSILAH